MTDSNSTNVTSFVNVIHANYSNFPRRRATPGLPVSLLVTTTTLYVMVFVVGVLGNFAVISVVLRCRSMRTFINFLFVNLCLADLFVLLISGPTAVLDIYAKEVWYLGENMCKFVPFLENAVSHAVVATILTISLERYRVACRSETHVAPSPRAIVLTFIIIWMMSIISAVPVLFITEYRKRNLVDGTPVYVCTTSIYYTWHKVYMVLITSFFFVIPFLFILLLYTKVCFALMFQFRKERQLEMYPSEIVRLKRQMIQIIVTVVLVFFVCHSPYRALAMWTMFEDYGILRKIHPNVFLTIFYCARILLYSNHAINPFVYNFVAKKFRRALLWVCCDRRRKRASCKDKYMYDIPAYDRQFNVGTQKRFPRRSSYLMRAVGNERVEDGFEHADRSHRNDFMILYENMLL